MNAQRRKLLDAIAEKLRDLRDDLEAIKDEEQDALDNLPDSIRDGERGQKMEEGIEGIEDAQNNIDEATEALSQAVAV